jgi:hypothetical protein
MRKIVAGLFMLLDGIVDSPVSSPHVEAQITKTQNLLVITPLVLRVQ